MEAVCSSNRTLKGILLTAVLLLAASAFAAANNKGHMALLNSATIGGTQLSPGDYTVQWTGTGDQVQLEVLRGKKTVATVPAHITKLDHPARQDSVLVEPNDQGGQAVSRINFGKKDFALELQNGAGGASGSSSSAR